MFVSSVFTMRVILTNGYVVILCSTRLNGPLCESGSVNAGEEWPLLIILLLVLYSIMMPGRT